MHFANQTRILWHEISIKIALKISINCNNCIRAEFRCHYLSIHLRKIPEEGKFTSFSTYLSIRLTLCCHIFNNDDNDNICTRAISLVCVCGLKEEKKLLFSSSIEIRSHRIGSALHDLCQFDKIILLSIINVCRHPSAPQPSTRLT